MGLAEETAFLDATAQAELVRRGEVSAAELTEAAITRIQRLNAQVNAVVWPLFDEALDAARGPLAHGPFTGVPFLVKDLIAAAADAPMAMGCGALRGYRPGRDSELVRRYRRAGLIVVGKTNTPEFGLTATTEPLAFGATRNPWDPERSAGGSSGGSAAAVACGMTAMAHGGDGGGSLRIPASCCGLFGLKPSRGRNPLGPDAGDLLGGLVAEHGLTRSVRDSAALLDATQGPMAGDPYAAPAPVRPYALEVGANPGRLRIGFTTASWMGGPVDAECVKAVETAARLCEALGHEVEEVALPIDGAAFSRYFGAMWAAGCAWTLDDAARALGRPFRADDVEPMTWALAERGRSVGGAAVFAAMAYMQGLGRMLGAYFSERQVYLTPTVAALPPVLGELTSPAERPLEGMFRAAAFAPFTALANGTGVPAMSAPLYWSARGLPVGVQAMAAYGDEATLFRLAGQWEQARPWADRRPVLR